MQQDQEGPIRDPSENRTPARKLREALRNLILAHGTLDGARRPCGTPLPIPHAWALMELHRNGPMTITELAGRLSIDRTNVSRLCSRMESLGELTREEHPEDKRARLLQLTPQGVQNATNVDDHSLTHFERVVGHLQSRLDADTALVTRALQQLSHAMNSIATRNAKGST